MMVIGFGIQQLSKDTCRPDWMRFIQCLKLLRRERVGKPKRVSLAARVFLTNGKRGRSNVAADLGTGGLSKGLIPSAIHLSMSTISTATAVELASAHA